MPAERFYIDTPLTGTLSLEGTEFHHLAHVMRIRIGEEIELVNGHGALAKAKVLSISKHAAALEILSASQIPCPAPRMILAIPFLRLSKLELIVEKCTELGADAFWFYPAQYSEKAELSAHQLERLEHIAVSAMKQCGRLDLPSLKVLSRFEDLFKTTDPHFFGDTRPQAQKITPREKSVFITGPEKGFSEKELEFLDKKAIGIRLHKNILRAETAPIVAAILSL